MSFVELRSRTNASFLQGASQAEEMVDTAQALGYDALAITDINELGGSVRAHDRARKIGQPILIGTELTPDSSVSVDQVPVVLIARNRQGYGRMCRLLTDAKRKRPRGEPGITAAEVCAEPDGLIALLTAPCAEDVAHQYRRAFGDNAGVLVTCNLLPAEAQLNRARRSLAEATHLPLVATGDSRYHDALRKPLYDVLTAVHHGAPLAECGYRLPANAEQHLRPPRALADRFVAAGMGAAVDQGHRLLARCDFSMNELRFIYPEKHLAAGETPISFFRQAVMNGARERYGPTLPPGAMSQLGHELDMIERMKVEGFFLTMYDIVRFARSRAILCQGRGSAANSAVCYALGITSVDPVGAGLLFERFLSEERGEPPDIDVDFEHERREEVIQWVYSHYGREHSGLVCNNICYRPRSAVRDVGKALGLTLDQVDRLAKGLGRSREALLDDGRLLEAGIAPSSEVARQLRDLIPQVLGFPRHRGTHVGGMVVTNEPLIETAPLEDAAMEGRTILPWDKDDCDALGMCKFD
ncbi:MAG: error-prone DNA polymerase, partial [Myxococcota bacterium]